jgi:hypothetical protein
MNSIYNRTDEEFSVIGEVQANFIANDPLYQQGFKAGAASRDAEIAELVGALGDVTAHLVAAHSLLSRGGKKAAASDTVFKIMLQDYEKSFEAGRKALAKVRKP